LEGDLKVHLLNEAACLGLLKDVDPVRSNDILYVNHILEGLAKKKVQESYTHLMYSDLVSTVAMAIGNRNEYSNVYKSFAENRDRVLRALIPRSGEEPKSEDDDMMKEWEEIFGMKPEEYEKKFFEERAKAKAVDERVPQHKAREFLRRLLQ